MKKSGKRKTINLSVNFTNRWLYTFIALGILITVSVGVFAAVNKAGAYHDSQTIEVTINGVTKSLQEAINEGDLARDTRCDAEGVCSTVYADAVSIGGVRMESWPAPQAICPEGTNLVTRFVNEGEDTYGVQTGPLAGRPGGYCARYGDSCDGQFQVGYTCPVSRSVVNCVDIYASGEDCYSRVITCVAVAGLYCRSP